MGAEAHDEVEDAVVDRVCGAVRDGMGLVVLHSAHHSKVFRRLMGTSCDLTWRESGDRERDLNVSYMSGNDVPLTDPERTAEAVTEIAADAAGARIRAVIVVTVSHYRIDRTIACGRTGKQLQQSLSVVGAAHLLVFVQQRHPLLEVDEIGRAHV